MIRYQRLNEFLDDVRVHKPKLIRLSRFIAEASEPPLEDKFFLVAGFLVEPQEVHELMLPFGQAHIETNDYDRLVQKVAQEATLLTLDIRNVSPATAIRGGRYEEAENHG